jgi:hypothetical protein
VLPVFVSQYYKDLFPRQIHLNYCRISRSVHMSIAVRLFNSSDILRTALKMNYMIS